MTIEKDGGTCTWGVSVVYESNPRFYCTDLMR